MTQNNLPKPLIAFVNRKSSKPSATAITITTTITIIEFVRTDFQLAHEIYFASDFTDLNHPVILFQREGLSFFAFFVFSVFAFSVFSTVLISFSDITFLLLKNYFVSLCKVCL